MFSASTFKTYRQYDAMDCGPTCLRMVAKHYGRSYTMETLRNRSGINREGVSLLGISEAAESLGFRTVGAKITWQQLNNQAFYLVSYIGIKTLCGSGSH